MFEQHCVRCGRYLGLYPTEILNNPNWTHVCECGHEAKDTREKRKFRLSVYKRYRAYGYEATLAHNIAKARRYPLPRR